MPPSLPRRRTEGGFSLLEVVVATAVLSLGLCMLMVQYQGQSQLDRVSDEVDIANNAARQKLEEVRAITLDQNYGTPLTVLNALHNTWFSVPTGNKDNKHNPIYLKGADGTTQNVGRISVTQMGNDLAEVAVTVQWQSLTGNNSRTVTTRIVRP